jgi:hypothetical protein
MRFRDCYLWKLFVKKVRYQDALHEAGTAQAVDVLNRTSRGWRTQLLDGTADKTVDITATTFSPKQGGVDACPYDHPRV